MLRRVPGGVVVRNTVGGNLAGELGRSDPLRPHAATLANLIRSAACEAGTGAPRQPERATARFSIRYLAVDPVCTLRMQQARRTARLGERAVVAQRPAPPHTPLAVDTDGQAGSGPGPLAGGCAGRLRSSHTEPIMTRKNCERQ